MNPEQGSRQWQELIERQQAFDRELQTSEELWYQLSNNIELPPPPPEYQIVRNRWEAFKKADFEQALGESFFDFEQLIKLYPDARILLIVPNRDVDLGRGIVKSGQSNVGKRGIFYTPIKQNGFPVGQKYKYSFLFKPKQPFHPARLNQREFENYFWSIIFQPGPRTLRHHMDNHLRRGNLELACPSVIEQIKRMPNLKEGQRFMVAVPGRMLDFPFGSDHYNNYLYGYRFEALRLKTGEITALFGGVHALRHTCAVSHQDLKEISRVNKMPLFLIEEGR